MKATYMFQFAVTNRIGFGSHTDIIEDTGLITKERALALFEEHKLRYIKALESEDQEPSLVIWQDCKDENDYHTKLLDLEDSDVKYDGKEFYRVKKVYIDIP